MKPINTNWLPDGKGEWVGLDNDLVLHFPVTELENNTNVTTIQTIERFEFSIWICSRFLTYGLDDNVLLIYYIWYFYMVYHHSRFSVV